MKKIIIASLFVISSIGLMGVKTAHAYEEGEADPLQNNTQTIKQEETGSVEIDGWIGTFDPTQPVDPTKPQPSDEDKDWVDVTLPTKLLFGSLKSDNGAVYSPKYAITNNSVKKVEVSATELTSVSNPVSSGLNLNLAINSTEVPLITNGTTYLNSKTELVTLDAKTGQEFTLKGTFSGTYPTVAQGALSPKYNLDLNFATVK